MTMVFERVKPNDESMLEQYRAGPVEIVVLAYAFGQHRIQVWYSDERWSVPNILMPNF